MLLVDQTIKISLVAESHFNFEAKSRVRYAVTERELQTGISRQPHFRHFQYVCFPEQMFQVTKERSDTGLGYSADSSSSTSTSDLRIVCPRALTSAEGSFKSGT
jgi:hypothetical protein